MYRRDIRHSRISLFFKSAAPSSLAPYFRLAACISCAMFFLMLLYYMNTLQKTQQGMGISRL
ncbi:hypothetical protein DWZ56_14450 [Lachnotalea sp. AF33-28]|nr:hypothetical protein DWZ56_14450 [Lachnotalea sp. AF33-28]